jgi:uncharacterized protein with FMN-binding domain
MDQSPFAPPQVKSAASSDVDAALAARLERLAASRVRSAESTSPPSAAPTARTTTPGRRRHPARGARIAALGASVVTSGGLGAVFYLAGQSSATIEAAPSGIVPSAQAAAAASPIASSPVTVDLTIPPVEASSPVTPQTVPAATSATMPPVAQIEVPATVAATEPVVVNGDAFNNKWGTVQVQATFNADGSLLGVDVIQVPSADRKSVRINDRAVPVLNQEALSAQRADIDTVSGATYTSHDYVRSLQSAIDIARSYGVTQIA